MWQFYRIQSLQKQIFILKENVKGYISDMNDKDKILEHQLQDEALSSFVEDLSCLDQEIAQDILSNAHDHVLASLSEQQSANKPNTPLKKVMDSFDLDSWV